MPSLWDQLTSFFQPGQPFRSGNPALDQMMLARAQPDPQSRAAPPPLGQSLMDLSSMVAPYLVGGAPGGTLSSGMKVPRGLIQASEEAAPAVTETAAPTEQIAALMRQTDHGAYGLRISDEPFNVGERLKPSQIFEQEEPTGKFLPGTSVVSLEGSEPEHIATALRNAGIGQRGPNGIYFGKHVALVGGEPVGWGEDVGERILRNPTVLGTFEKADEGAGDLISQSSADVRNP